MKLIVLSCSLMLVSMVTAFPASDESVMEELQKLDIGDKVTGADSSRVQLIKLYRGIVTRLCSQEHVDEKILTDVCLPAVTQQLKVPAKRSGSQHTATTLNCMNCQYADPLCQSSCPY